MALTILDILDLQMPFGLGTRIFTDFYIEAERLITLSQSRDTEILNLYDLIISTIDESSLSDARRTKTWITEAYVDGKENNRLYIENHYLKVVNFVALLQLLVLDRYDSIDQFYELEGVIVSVIFASISEDAGYSISPQYIEEIS